MAEAAFKTIRDQAKYDGGYWNTTGIARAVTVKGLLPAMLKERCTVLAHGATGRGNDQMRFEYYTIALYPGMKVYAPWRDPILLEEFPGRKQMVAYLQKLNIEAEVGEKKRYSTDANVAGLSHEAEDLELLITPMTIVNPTMGVWPKDAPDEEEIFEVRFQDGFAVSINGELMDPFNIMLKANEMAGRNGIGMKHALENRFIGTKSRGVYEAPGMELLGRCLEYVYQAVMDKHATGLFHILSDFIAKQIYEARYFDSSTVAAQAAVKEMASHAIGTVKVELYKGNIHSISLTDCPRSLYNEDDASMEKSKGLNPESSQGFAEIIGVEARTKGKAGQIKRF